MHRTDGGKPRKAVKDDADEEVRTPFDAKAETPTMPSDGSFQGGGKPYSRLGNVKLNCMPSQTAH